MPDTNKKNRSPTRQSLGPSDPAGSRVPIVVALIASATSIAGFALTYVFTERTRTEIAAQTVQLDRIRVDVAAAAQRTAEVVARLDEARLELEQQIARSTERLESRKVQIEGRRGFTEEVKLTNDFTKISNDLRPNIAVSCNREPLDGLVLRVACSFTNKGGHRVRVVPTTFSMLNGSDRTGIPGAIQKIDDANANTILPNGAGSDKYLIVLTQAGAAVKNPVIRIQFESTTDKVAIAMTTRLTKGVITDDEIRELSKQAYTIELQ